MAITGGAGKEGEKKTHSQASLATIGTIIILQRTNNFIVGIGDREGAGQRASGRHGAYMGRKDPLPLTLGGKEKGKKRREANTRGKRVTGRKRAEESPGLACSLSSLWGRKEKEKRKVYKYIEGLDPPSS